MALAKSFDLAPLGETPITTVRVAAKIPLNAIRVAGDQRLTEKLTETLTEVLAFLERREEWEAANPLS